MEEDVEENMTLLRQPLVTLLLYFLSLLGHAFQIFVRIAQQSYGDRL